MRISATGLRRSRPATDSWLRRGFSLIEIMAVVVIIAVLSAAMVPSFVSGMDRARVTGSLSRIGQAMAFAGNLAATERKNFRLNIDRAAGRFWIGFETTQQDDLVQQEALRLSDLSSWTLDESIRISELRIDGWELEDNGDEVLPFIVFRPDGTADSAMIVLETESGHVYTVLLSGITGRVRILDYAVGEDGLAPPEA